MWPATLSSNDTDKRQDIIPRSGNNGNPLRPCLRWTVWLFWAAPLAILIIVSCYNDKYLHKSMTEIFITKIKLLLEIATHQHSNA